jgi:hypothetical protein
VKISEIAALADKMGAGRGWEPDSPHYSHLLSLIIARENARERILNQAKLLRADIDSLERRITDFPSPVLNTTGELQRRPAALESAVGQFTVAVSLLADYLAERT